MIIPGTHRPPLWFIRHVRSQLMGSCIVRKPPNLCSTHVPLYPLSYICIPSSSHLDSDGIQNPNLHHLFYTWSGRARRPPAVRASARQLPARRLGLDGPLPWAPWSLWDPKASYQMHSNGTQNQQCRHLFYTRCFHELISNAWHPRPHLFYGVIDTKSYPSKPECSSTASFIINLGTM